MYKKSAIIIKMDGKVIAIAIRQEGLIVMTKTRSTKLLQHIGLMTESVQVRLTVPKETDSHSVCTLSSEPSIEHILLNWSISDFPGKRGLRL